MHVTTDAAGGRVRVAIVDADGYDMEDCKPIISNCTDK